MHTMTDLSTTATSMATLSYNEYLLFNGCGTPSSNLHAMHTSLAMITISLDSSVACVIIRLLAVRNVFWCLMLHFAE